MRRSSLAALMAAFCLLAPAGAALAHHSFAMFDRSRPTTVSGTVKEFQWTNPHVWIQILVSGPDGEEEWGVECTSTNFMRRMGWSKESLKPGDRITIVIYPLKDGSKGGQFARLTALNGSAKELPGYGGRR